MSILKHTTTIQIITTKMINILNRIITVETINTEKNKQSKCLKTIKQNTDKGNKNPFSRKRLRKNKIQKSTKTIFPFYDS